MKTGMTLDEARQLRFEDIDKCADCSRPLSPVVDYHSEKVLRWHCEYCIWLYQTGQKGAADE